MSNVKSYDVREVLDYLAKIEKINLHLTDHFRIRANERKSDIYPDTNGIVDIILNDIPCGILKQSDDKFKLIYNLNTDDDCIIIVSVKNSSPIRINLVSTFPDEAKKRRREDGSGE